MPGIAGEVERQLSPHDQLLEKLFGARATGERHFERRDAAEMQIRTQIRGRMCAGLVAFLRIAPQIRVQKTIEPLLRLEPSTSKKGRWCDGMVDVARRHERRNVIHGYRRMEFGRPAAIGAPHGRSMDRSQVLRSLL
jgi:hypothetical protein